MKNADVFIMDELQHLHRIGRLTAFTMPNLGAAAEQAAKDIEAFGAAMSWFSNDPITGHLRIERVDPALWMLFGIRPQLAYPQPIRKRRRRARAAYRRMRRGQK